MRGEEGLVGHRAAPFAFKVNINSRNPTSALSSVPKSTFCVSDLLQLLVRSAELAGHLNELPIQYTLGETSLGWPTRSR